MQIEQRGVDTVLGSDLALGVIVFGRLPVSFGLGRWASFTSLLVGTVAGTVLVAPLALVSLRTATNLSTSGGVHVGVRGRLLGSVIGLLLSLGCTALTLWFGGDAVVGCLDRLVGLTAGGRSHAVVHALLAACTATSAVFGYRMLLRLSRALSVGLTALLVIGVVAYAGDFTTAAPADTEYLLGGFWPTWLLATVSAGLSGPIAFITLLGDCTRSISPRRFSQPRVFRRGRGGPYWYRGGWNVQAAVAWAAGSGIGLPCVDTPAYSGPLLPVTGGIDLSFLISGGVTAAVYLVLHAGRPHPVPPARTPERIAVTV
ncbi:cytosine permease [Actinacidiphila glaucinigra]|uniref:cytosine permease n=1 Tax=Actinacidiphila glaucinigra TaxID=235986 RepID=UPI003246E9B2